MYDCQHYFLESDTKITDTRQRSGARLVCVLYVCITNGKLCMSHLMVGTYGTHTIIHGARAALLWSISPILAALCLCNGSDGLWFSVFVCTCVYVCILYSHKCLYFCLQSSFLLVDNYVWAGSLFRTIYILDSDTSTGEYVYVHMYVLCVASFCIYVYMYICLFSCL